ncbi:MAG: hypothetical protein J2P36_40215, partial [Ktedonobacteraceae bacterium]|nr:hypothetical protein [Ktedonobacteraceae bacterium]
MTRSNNQNDQDKAPAHRKHRRRASGEGSVYQRKSDKRWVASIPLEDGTRREYYFKRQQDAVAKLQQAQYEKKQGLLATGPHQTVKQFLETWLNIHSPNLRSTSYAAYEQLIRNHITPAIGHIQLQKLTSQHVQTLYSQRLKDGYAPETVRAIHRMLHRAFSDAVEWKLIGYNVCAKGKVKQPRRVKHEIQPLTKEQAQALLAAAKGHW